jgi:phage terminase large subunit GpA-like protein
MVKKEAVPIVTGAEKEQKPQQTIERKYYSVHCPYCGEQRLYAEDGGVYCDNGKCPNKKKPVDVDRYNLRRFLY